MSVAPNTIDVDTTVLSTKGAVNSSNNSTASKRKLKGPNFVSVLLHALHPKTCLRACHGTTVDDECDEPVNLDDIMSGILENIENDDEEMRTTALGDLHRLVGKTSSHNRIPIVCTTKWNVISILSTRLYATENSDERRMVCLILNNLSIPYDNKAIMVLGPQRDVLLPALLHVLRANLPEAYLCCVCLMNLSILDDGKQILLKYEPPSAPVKYSVPLTNPLSLIRTLEQMMTVFAPFLLSTTQSVEGHAIRWAVGFLRNLSTVPDNALLLAQTTIPSLAGGFIQNSPHPLCKWTRDSLEDLSLSFLLKLVNDPHALLALRQHHKELPKCLQKLVGTSGIHGMRGTLIASQVRG